MLLKNWMRKDLITVAEDDILLDALHLMKDNGIRRLPVLKKDKLVGMITEKDIGRYAPSSASTLDKHEMLYALSKSLVKDVMTKKVITVNEDAPIERAAVLLRDHKFGGLPVMDENDNLVGIITAVDIFEIFATSLGFKYPSTRIAILLEDRSGALAEITAIINTYKLNIISLGTFFLKDSDGRDVVLRINGDKVEIEKAVQALKDAGFNLVSVMDMEEVLDTP